MSKIFTLLAVVILLVILITGCSPAPTVTVTVSQTSVIPMQITTVTKTIVSTVNAISTPTNTSSSNITISTSPSAQVTTIQSIKLVILQNTTTEFVFGFNYFDANGNAVHFQNADLTVNLGISGTAINAGTQKSVNVTILSGKSPAIVGARTTINPPTVKTSEDSVTIPRNILNLQGVIDNNVMIEAVLNGKSNPPLEGYMQFDIIIVQLAQ